MHVDIIDDLREVIHTWLICFMPSLVPRPSVALSSFQGESLGMRRTLCTGTHTHIRLGLVNIIMYVLGFLPQLLSFTHHTFTDLLITPPIY